MYRLLFSKIFHTDVDSNYKYISEILEAPGAADNLIEELINKLNYIKETPYTRPLVQDNYLASIGIRSIKVKNYIVYYTIEEDKKNVNVIRFLYGKRDWVKILKEISTDEIIP